jgi:hypothetical protein
VAIFSDETDEGLVFLSAAVCLLVTSLDTLEVDRMARINGNSTGVVGVQTGLLRGVFPLPVQSWVPAQGQGVRVLQMVALPIPETLFPPAEVYGCQLNLVG